MLTIRGKGHKQSQQTKTKSMHSSTHHILCFFQLHKVILVSGVKNNMHDSSCNWSETEEITSTLDTTEQVISDLHLLKHTCWCFALQNDIRTPSANHTLESQQSYSQHVIVSNKVNEVTWIESRSLCSCVSDQQKMSWLLSVSRKSTIFSTFPSHSIINK